MPSLRVQFASHGTFVVDGMRLTLVSVITKYALCCDFQIRNRNGEEQEEKLLNVKVMKGEKKHVFFRNYAHLEICLKLMGLATRSWV